VKSGKDIQSISIQHSEPDQLGQAVGQRGTDGLDQQPTRTTTFLSKEIEEVEYQECCRNLHHFFEILRSWKKSGGDSDK
jgi:hypothetical protein